MCRESADLARHQQYRLKNRLLAASDWHELLFFPGRKYRYGRRQTDFDPRLNPKPALPVLTMLASELFTLPPSLASFATFFAPDVAPWVWVERIAAALESVSWKDFPLRKDLPPGLHIEGRVYLHPTVKLPPYGVIQGPVWIGAQCDLRPGVFIRGNVIVGERVVMGNSCEYKNCLLLNGAQTPHYNYVGDSVLGQRAHLGAGAICANLRLDRKNVPVQTPAGRVATPLRKLGALMGDDSEAGCNSVLQPGVILGRRAAILPGIAFNGYLPPNTLAAVRTEIRHLPRPE